MPLEAGARGYDGEHPGGRKQHVPWLGLGFVIGRPIISSIKAFEARTKSPPETFTLYVPRGPNNPDISVLGLRAVVIAA